MKNPKPDYYKLSTRKLVHKLLHKEIIYFHSKNMKTTFYTLNGGPYIVSKNIGMVCSEINNPCMFIKIGRSTYVNMQHIRYYDKERGRVIIMANNLALTISRREKSNVLKTYLRDNTELQADATVLQVNDTVLQTVSTLPIFSS
jgi:DNA-binding LytR/AlgR family response regulator